MKNLNKIFNLLICSFVLSMLFSSSLLAETEPNGSCAEAHLVELNSTQQCFTVSGEVGDGNAEDIDLYKIYLPDSDNTLTYIIQNDSGNKKLEYKYFNTCTDPLSPSTTTINNSDKATDSESDISSGEYRYIYLTGGSTNNITPYTLNLQLPGCNNAGGGTGSYASPYSVDSIDDYSQPSTYTDANGPDIVTKVSQEDGLTLTAVLLDENGAVTTYYPDVSGDIGEMLVSFYLADANCNKIMPLTITNESDIPVETKIAHYLSSGISTSFEVPEYVIKDARIVMHYLDTYAGYLETLNGCMLTSSSSGNFEGIPNCGNSENKLINAFGDAAVNCLDYNNLGYGPCKSQYGTGTPLIAGFDIDWGCFQCIMGQQPDVCSVDHFAIRPEKFDVVMPDPSNPGSTHPHEPNLLRAGQDYGVSLTAKDADNDIPVRYTITSPDNFNDDLDSDVIKYFNDNANTIDTLGLLHGTSDLNKSIIVPAYMLEGLSSTSPTKPDSAEVIVNVSYDDVGKVTLQIYDNEWAAVDVLDGDTNTTTCDDTIPHTRICGDKNVTFIPHHFGFAELNITNHGGPSNSEFTYIADRRGMPEVSAAPVRSMMAARVQTRIEALAESGTITENFREDDGSYLYYENPISVILDVEVPPDGTTDGYLYPDANESNISTQLIGFGRTGTEKDANGTRNIKWDESTYPLDFNFQREINEKANPFEVDGSYLAISVLSTYSQTIASVTTVADINGSRIGSYLATSDPTRWTACSTDEGCESTNAENNATFYYGRTRSALSFYDNVKTASKITPIYIDVYCNLSPTVCNTFGINTVSGQVNTEWWLSWNHQMSQQDGDISLTIDTVNTPNGEFLPSATTTEEPTIQNSQGADETVEVAYTGTTAALPYTVNIDFVIDDTLTNYTNEWLIYNKDGPYAPSPFYRVRFIGAISAANWAGHGDTGFVVDSNTTTNTNNRVGW